MDVVVVSVVSVVSMRHSIRHKITFNVMFSSQMVSNSATEIMRSHGNESGHGGPV